MINVLDIDIDLFVDPWTSKRSERLDGRVVDAAAWPYSRVRKYLKCAVDLSADNELAGKAFETHDQLLYTLYDIGSPVRLFHFDAHADLGLGRSLQERDDFHLRFLAIDPIDRPARLIEFSPKEGDFLLYAIACGFVARLDYVTHPDVYVREPDVPTDMVEWVQKYATGHVNIKRFTGTERHLGRNRPETLDRSIPIRMYHRDEMQLEGIAFDYMFITRSPWYTPVGSDRTYLMLQEDFLGIATNGC